MNTGWSLYIAILTVVNIVACLWLLWWTRKRPGKPEADTTGHVWDGDLTEYNKPLPRWWLNLFYLTIVFGFAYLAWFPGLGAFSGAGGWSSAEQHRIEREQAQRKLEPLFAQYRARSVAELAADPGAVALGRSVFANNCATCHGSDARGALGFPNLADRDWLWGGEPDTVLATILDGRNAVMPALGAALNEHGVTEAAVYVQSLSGAPADATLASRGARHFAGLCAACHGADGRGNPALGAPNLTDDIWLYGGSFDAIAASVRTGRNGHMPAHREILGEDRARLVAAFVLSQRPAAAAVPAPAATH